MNFNIGSGDDRIILRASQEVASRELLRQALEPYVTTWTEQIMTKRKISVVRKAEIIAVGMKPFDKVFSIFIKNPENLHRTSDYFFQYYRWWMRQIVIKYLEE
jgi:hypothetical protein